MRILVIQLKEVLKTLPRSSDRTTTMIVYGRMWKVWNSGSTDSKAKLLHFEGSLPLLRNRQVANLDCWDDSPPHSYWTQHTCKFGQAHVWLSHWAAATLALQWIDQTSSGGMRILRLGEHWDLGVLGVENRLASHLSFSLSSSLSLLFHIWWKLHILYPFALVWAERINVTTTHVAQFDIWG
jgi:hypothetical protein